MANTAVEGGSMTNLRLAEAFLLRASSRLEALDSLRAEAEVSDVVREARDIAELCFRGMLRSVGVAVPRWIEIGDAVRENMSRLPADVTIHKERILGVYSDLQEEKRDLLPDDPAAAMEMPVAREAELAFANAKWILQLARLTVDIVAHRGASATPV